MTKIVINDCFGGFGLSPKALKRYAELKGKECYFFKSTLDDKYTPLKIEEIESIFWTAFTVPNPEEVLPKEKIGEYGNYLEYNQAYGKIELNSRDISRTDLYLIKVVEELGKDANDYCSELKVVEIPDDIEWTIEEYDGNETIHEKHRSWG